MDPEEAREEEEEEENITEQRINYGMDGELILIGYRKSMVKTVATWIGIVSTCFLLRLFFYWKNHLFLKATHSMCPLSDADSLLITDQYRRLFVCELKTISHEGKVSFAPRSPARTDTENETSQPLLSRSRIDTSMLLYFVHEEVKYIWNPALELFERLTTFPNATCGFFVNRCPLLVEQIRRRSLLYGDNTIVVPITPLIILLIKEALHPFYIFQMGSIALWMCDQYQEYACTILFISLLSVSATMYETRKAERALKQMVSSSSSHLVSVSRDGDFVDLTADQLVPGDIIQIPRNGCEMLCDAILLSGNCIVNECMLTGESVPVTKIPLVHSKEKFEVSRHSRHLLFCGTRVIQTRNYEGEPVRAIVYRTGFHTAKGELVRAIMFPKPISFKFNNDALNYVKVMFIFALVGFAFTVALMIHKHRPARIVALRSLDLITTVVPAALPAAMTVGIVIAQSRLRNKNSIFCISPNTINICGSINAVAFDKTGTLTEEGLDLRSVLVANEPEGSLRVEVMPQSLPTQSPLLACMSACHSLTFIEGEICGDPLDLKMFEATGWTLEEPPMGEEADKADEADRFRQLVPRVVKSPAAMQSPEVSNDRMDAFPMEIGLLREFPFSSSLQRMAVLGRVLGENHYTLFLKGSPEMVFKLCAKETLPYGLNDQLAEYTRQGYRVLAMAWRPVTNLNVIRVHKVLREEIEKDLIFAGLLVMENRLKPETIPAIKILRDAKIRTLMVTGDNLLTAISVARECHMIDPKDQVVVVSAILKSYNYLDVAFYHAKDLQIVKVEFVSVYDEDGNEQFVLSSGSQAHLAVTGKDWQLIRRYKPELLSKLAVTGTVFARFSPEQKGQLIEALQDVDYYVCMCGDGANDCGALKTAHAGISLSEAEASVASPFTSQRQNISCVPALIREGRCALVTSFGIFKFMSGYSMLQFTTVLILYYFNSNLSNWEFMYIDLFIITTLCITFGYTPPSSQLHPEGPPVRLINVPTVLGLLLQIINFSTFLFFALVFLHWQPWYSRMHTTDDDPSCYENTILFSVSVFQYISLCVVYSRGEPYRKPMFKNKWFMLNLIILLLMTCYLIMDACSWLRDLFQMYNIPKSGKTSYMFKAVLVGWSTAHFFIAHFIETAMVAFATRRLVRKIRGRSPKAHKLLQRQLSERWPPISRQLDNVNDLDREMLENGAS